MNVKAFFGFLVFVLIIITLAVTIISFSSKSENGTNLPKIEISKYIKTDSQAVYTVRGRIVANEEHKGYRITVTKTSRKLEILSGYDNRVVSSKTFSNTEAAYEEFIYALQRAGFSSLNNDDLRGICANGSLYTYEFSNEDKLLARQYSSTCGDKSLKNFHPDNLFKTQIPEFSQLTSGINL